MGGRQLSTSQPWVDGRADRLLGATNWFSSIMATPIRRRQRTVIDVPGATPSQLVLALGKDGNAYLVDRNNLGGITAPLAQANVFAGNNRGTSAVTYRTNEGTYFAFHNDAGGPLAAYRITETNPPLIVGAWRLSQSGRGSPWITTPDGRRNSIGWVVGA
jgi:hypothetical protein